MVTLQVTPEIEVSIWCKFKMVDNGIGSYEYFGFKSVHVDMCPEVIEDSIQWDKSLYSVNENKLISSFIDYCYENAVKLLEDNFNEDDLVIKERNY